MEISNYLKFMVEHNASDLFFSVGAPVNIKIEGETSSIGDKNLTSSDVRQLAYSIMNDDQVTTFESRLELNMAFSVANMGRFRVNVFRQRGDTAMVIRYIKSKIPSIEALGLPDILKDLIMEYQGLILVVGSTGSGKSTTLASMINYRNEKKTGHILTIEDPIEFIHEHKKSIVDQREVGLDTLSLSEALMNALREAPDVIVVGEIRDRETMRHALHYAETGHLCLSTLHANNANQTMERIINFFPDTAHHGLLLDLGQHLRAIISQRLINGINGKRAPAVEIMLKTPFIAELIEDHRISEIKDAMEQGTLAGMQTFDQSLYKLFKDGKITIDEALRNADSKNNLRLRLRLEDPEQFTSDDKLQMKEDEDLVHRIDSKKRK
ncbi:MAG: type IV pili twitching motility protein PilT [Gammaproteobacteria bacterium RIFCSPLOWO2_02_FULL_47_50]|jgi:twitching motility protein PilU|nr:MAG: type IV pili twitching motility protein PilT [Gammaproteobacteria bacterium RIFCSPLOWO2_01_FULL_47_190]OGT81052.1 MAG: type IV pili twitching motility protein PilT [Gammaproteobacteria bacterium RIFCSPLOWO2_02_FULL_47_50]OGT84925.1 MAG: type IV pili twitching motility protein PilT [Gammaproteobacteria bacterium RIFCSPLOWO2_12_FULL_47_76]